MVRSDIREMGRVLDVVWCDLSPQIYLELYNMYIDGLPSRMLHVISLERYEKHCTRHIANIWAHISTWDGMMGDLKSGYLIGFPMH